MKKVDNEVFLTYKKYIKEAINDLKTKGRRHRQIPNILTLLRLTAPCFIMPAAATANIPLVLGLTAFFSLTDLADGFIARNWKLTSELGATLDAVTDKVFAATLLSAASFSNPILLCNLGLEALIAGINVNKKLNNKPVQSSFIGKIKTWFLFALTGIGIISSYFDITTILNSLMAATTIMQIATIGSYLVPNSNNKESEQVKKEEKEYLINDNNDVKEKELVKEKATTKTENNHVQQLKEIREFLVTEKEFLQPELNQQTKTKEKSKKDDLKN